jgi:aminoglycoside phosphotransferase (APT) family kinase protein
MPEPDDSALLARGRDADVYALDDATVLRRVRDPEHARTRHEARIMAYLAERGYPVPRVYDADDTAIVMQRLTGPTLLESWQRRPWTLRANARLLASLHDALGKIPAPDWLEAPPGRPRTASRRAVMHLDLHPGNVILTARGPVVIDWTTCAAGEPALDLAKTLITIGTADLPPGPQRVLRDRYVKALGKAARTDPRPRLADAARQRLGDPNISPAEAARLRAVLARETGGPAAAQAPAAA